VDSLNKIIMKNLMMLLLLCVVGCSSPENKSDVVSVEEFRNKITLGATLLDVRTPEEYASGHIAGAVNIDVKDPLFEDRISSLTRATTYAVYCASGVRSGNAAKIMKEKGFSSVVTLDGGMKMWKQKDLPVE